MFIYMFECNLWSHFSNRYNPHSAISYSGSSAKYSNHFEWCSLFINAPLLFLKHIREITFKWFVQVSSFAVSIMLTWQRHHTSTISVFLMIISFLNHFQDIELSKEINDSFKQSSQARTKLPTGIEMSVHVLTTGWVFIIRSLWQICWQGQ